MTLSRDQAAVSVRGVHKWYRIYASPTERIKRVFGRRSRYLDVQALDDVSFEVGAGSAVGIIGENGAGKSTLMKVVAGTTAPTAGEVEVRGVVAAILELGAAFHPEFSGKENAVLYGALMGLGREVMEARLDDIVAFAELGEFIHHPVKSYSTGMAMRLAFAVATHVDPDVLIVDEALAVGDGYFQKKCIDKIRRIKERGTTILFCSHAMYYVSMFCDHALWISRGRIEREGRALEVVEAYEAYLQARDSRRIADRETSASEGDGKQVGRITSIAPGGGADGLPVDLESGDELVVDVAFSSSRKDEVFHVAVTLDTLDGRCVLAAATHRDGADPVSGSTSYQVRFRVPSVPIAAGTFHIYAFLLDESGLHIHDQVILTEALRFSSSVWTPSLIEVGHEWEWR